VYFEPQSKLSLAWSLLSSVGRVESEVPWFGIGTTTYIIHRTSYIIHLYIFYISQSINRDIVSIAHIILSTIAPDSIITLADLLRSLLLLPPR
jgi:hypothetical protein